MLMLFKSIIKDHNNKLNNNNKWKLIIYLEHLLQITINQDKIMQIILVLIDILIIEIEIKNKPIKQELMIE